MKILYFIFGLFIFLSVAHSEGESEDGVPDRRTLNGRLRRLEETENQIENGNRRRHHFTHNAAWHRRHRIPMPINANRSSAELTARSSDGEITNRFNSEEIGSPSNNSGKQAL